MVKYLKTLYNYLTLVKGIANDTMIFLFGLLLVDAILLVVDGEGHTYSTIQFEWLSIDFRF